jgi:hypothetical protein
MNHSPHRRWALLLTLGLLLICGSPGVPATDYDPDLTYMTLSGLRSVAVRVDGVQRDFTRFGLDANTILDRTTRVLRENDVDVVDLETAKSNADTALMRIRIHTNENLFRFYNYSVSIELKQQLSLNNPAGGFVRVTTWQQGKTGIIMPTDLRQINDLIAGLLTEFIDDYLSQNPQRISAAR